MIIPPKNIGELVKSIKKIIDNEAQDLGKNGKKIIEEKFSWKVISSRILDEYLKLIHKK
ncbi:MAG: glycosyltransferase [Candidatus Helarchaeota archaeon]